VTSSRKENVLKNKDARFRFTFLLLVGLSTMAIMALFFGSLPFIAAQLGIVTLTAQNKLMFFMIISLGIFTIILIIIMSIIFFLVSRYEARKEKNLLKEESWLHPSERL